MRTAVLLSLLTTALQAQEHLCADQVRAYVAGELKLSWLRLGETLVKATMDEDPVPLLGDLLRELTDGTPAPRRDRAVAAMGRWSELPCFATLPAAQQLELQRLLLGAIEDLGKPAASRNAALLSLGLLSPRFSRVLLQKSEARLHTALQRRRDGKQGDEDPLLLGYLHYLGRMAPESAFALPIVIEVTAAAAPNDPMFAAGVGTIAAIGRQGLAADAHTAFVACGALVRRCKTGAATIAVDAMDVLLRAHPEVMPSEAAFTALLAVLEHADGVDPDEKTRLQRLQQPIRNMLEAGLKAIDQLEPAATRRSFDQRIGKAIDELPELDQHWHGIARAWRERPH